MLCVLMCLCVCFFFFFKQKTAYEMRISDWSSDVCSSDLPRRLIGRLAHALFEPFALDEAGADAVDAHFGPEHAGEAERQAVQRGFRGHISQRREIGRASCRERVCQYV